MKFSIPALISVITIFSITACCTCESECSKKIYNESTESAPTKGVRS